MYILHIAPEGSVFLLDDIFLIVSMRFDTYEMTGVGKAAVY